MLCVYIQDHTGSGIDKVTECSHESSWSREKRFSHHPFLPFLLPYICVYYFSLCLLSFSLSVPLSPSLFLCLSLSLPFTAPTPPLSLSLTDSHSLSCLLYLANLKELPGGHAMWSSPGGALLSSLRLAAGQSKLILLCALTKISLRCKGRNTLYL